MACSINANVLVGEVMIYLSQSWATRPLLEELGSTEKRKRVVRFNESSTGLNEGLMLSASTVAKLCGLRQSCYFIVGVFGVRGVATEAEAATSSATKSDMATVLVADPSKRSSTFTLMYSSSDDITDLLNLVPITSHCSVNKPQFYRYVLTLPSVVRTYVCILAC